MLSKRMCVLNPMKTKSSRIKKILRFAFKSIPMGSVVMEIMISPGSLCIAPLCRGMNFS